MTSGRIAMIMYLTVLLVGRFVHTIIILNIDFNRNRNCKKSSVENTKIPDKIPIHYLQHYKSIRNVTSVH